MANQSCDCESPPEKIKTRLSTRGVPSGVVDDSPGRIAAKRREALASHGKKALTGNQDGLAEASVAAAARALREEKVDLVPRI